jgi:hypothetical protein
MEKLNRLLFLVSLIISSFSLIKSSNLRKNDEIIPDINILLEGLPISYSILQNDLISQKPSISKELDLSYFKTLESNTNIKYYLNKELKDFDSIIKDIIKTIDTSNPQNGYVLDLFKNKIADHPEYFNFNKWVNFNIFTTVRNEKDTISFGSLFVSLNEGKFNFIFCYGYGNFKANFSGNNVVFLGKEGDYRYRETQRTTTYSLNDFDSYEEDYIIRFINLVAFKVLGNIYGIQLPYPEID